VEPLMRVTSCPSFVSRESMRTLFVSLLSVAVLSAAQQDKPAEQRTYRWIAAVLSHHPGEVDRALVDMAAEPSGTFQVVMAGLDKALRQRFSVSDVSARNDIRRRGALLHTDLALLLPGQAAAFAWKAAPQQFGPRGGYLDADSNVLGYSVDGQHRTSNLESGHWPLASWLLAAVEPDSSSDEFVRFWYRAVAATFLSTSRFGNATYHLARGQKALPRDPVLLLYAGAMHEALASPRVQNVRVTGNDLPSEREHIHGAVRDLSDALKYGAPPEAQLRLGRVTGRLGRHADAVSALELCVPSAGDARLAYFRELFLGTEYGALGRIDEARASFERAAALFPTAQAPLIALSDVCRRSGDRAGALAALDRLAALPSGRDDPWWTYYQSDAADAARQVKAVRAWVDLKEVR
jgi:tetratricopeptide (TPR) repeat protein